MVYIIFKIYNKQQCYNIIQIIIFKILITKMDTQNISRKYFWFYNTSVSEGSHFWYKKPKIPKTPPKNTPKTSLSVRVNWRKKNIVTLKITTRTKSIEPRFYYTNFYPFTTIFHLTSVRNG